MSTKVLVLLGLAALFLFLSPGAARTTATDVKDTTTAETKDVNDAKYGGGYYPPYGGYPGGRYGGGYYPPYGGYPGGRYGGGYYPPYGGYPGGRYGGGYYPPYGGRYGGGRGCYYGRCCGYGRCRCCAYEGEVIEAKPQNKG